MNSEKRRTAKWSSSAGRRRSGCLSGRRLSGAARGRHRARLDHRNLDRRHQCEPDRRQQARGPALPSSRSSGAGMQRPWRRRLPAWTGSFDAWSYWTTLPTAFPAFSAQSARLSSARIFLWGSIMPAFYSTEALTKRSMSSSICRSSTKASPRLTVGRRTCGPA